MLLHLLRVEVTLWPTGSVSNMTEWELSVTSLSNSSLYGGVIKSYHWHPIFFTIRQSLFTVTIYFNPTMFSKIFVNLTGIFLILYISATSSTPIEDSELQKINDDIHPRARPPYRPYRCQWPYAWMRRECLGAISPTAWQDVCGITNYYNGFQTQYDNQPGNCPPNTFCLNGYNSAGKRFITCVSTDKGKGKRPIDPQAGTSEAKRARPDLLNTQLMVSVKLDHDMTGAAVAAVVKSEFRTVNFHRCMLLYSC